jgi:hypothetical protein
VNRMSLSGANQMRTAAKRVPSVAPARRSDEVKVGARCNTCVMLCGWMAFASHHAPRGHHLN